MHWHRHQEIKHGHRHHFIYLLFILYLFNWGNGHCKQDIKNGHRDK